MSRAPTPRLLAMTFTRRSGWEKGRERNNTAFTMLKIAVFAPTPKARESTATIVKPGLFQSSRSAYRISCNSVVIKTPSSDPLPASPGCQRLFLLRVCLAARRQLDDLEIRRGTGQERAHRLRTHRE